MIRTLLITHAHMFVRDGSKKSLETYPIHMPIGKIALEELTGFVLKRIDEDQEGGGLTILAHGVGNKYEHIYRGLVRQAGVKYPNLQEFPFIDEVMGVSITALTKKGIVVTDLGLHHPIAAIRAPFRTQTTPKKAWKYVQDIETEANRRVPNSYAVLCGGRQFMTKLGKRNDFQIASVYELDWRRKEVERIFPINESTS